MMWPAVRKGIILFEVCIILYVPCNVLYASTCVCGYSNIRTSTLVQVHALTTICRKQVDIQDVINRNGPLNLCFIYSWFFSKSKPCPFLLDTISQELSYRTFSSLIPFLRNWSNFFLESPSQLAPMLHTRENRNHGSTSLVMAFSLSAGTVYPCMVKESDTRCTLYRLSYVILVDFWEFLEGAGKISSAMSQD